MTKPRAKRSATKPRPAKRPKSPTPAKSTPRAKRAPRANRKPARAEPAATYRELLRDAGRAIADHRDPRAFALMHKALAMARSHPRREQLQSQWWNWARSVQQEDPARGLAFFAEGLACVRNSDPPSQLTGDMWNEYGWLLHTVKRDDEAMQALERSRAIHVAAGRDENASWAIANLATVYFERGALVDAERLSREAVDRLRRCGNTYALPNVLYGLAFTLKEQGDEVGALAVLDDADAACEQTNRPDVRAHLINLRGNLALDDLRLDDAERHYETACTYYRQQHHEVAEAITISNLAIIDRWRGRPEAALKRANRAVRELKRLDDTRSLAISLTERGEIFTALGRFDDAARDFDGALVLLMANDNARRHMYARAALARLAEAQGARHDALAHYAEAEITFDQTTNPQDARSAVWALYATAGLLAEVGNLASAHEVLARGKSLESRTGSAARAATALLHDLAAARIALANGERDPARAAVAAASRGPDPLISRCDEVARVVGILATTDPTLHAPVE